MFLRCVQQYFSYTPPTLIFIGNLTEAGAIPRTRDRYIFPRTSVPPPKKHHRALVITVLIEIELVTGFEGIVLHERTYNSAINEAL